jgi:branched-chain amino acid transport system permease protein
VLISIIIGLSVGSIYGLTSMGLVLTYRTSGIFNLAHGAMGMLGTYVFWQLRDGWGLPMVPSLVLTLGVVAPLIGITCHYGLFRFVRDKPVVVTLVAGVALLIAIQGLVGVVWGTIYKDLESLFPYRLYRATSSFNVTSQQVGTAAVTLAVAIALLLYLNKTVFGLKVRAVVDNRELAQLSGTDAERVQAMSWAIAASVSTLAGIMISPLIQLSATGLTLVVIQAMAAAVVGGLRSLPLTYAGGLMLGLIESFLAKYLPSNQTAQGLKVSAAFLLLYAAVMVGSFYFQLFRDITGEVKEVLFRQQRNSARLEPLAVLLIAVAVALPFLPSYMAFLVVGGVIASIGFQGFVLVSGLGGQVLLCEASFVGIGAIMYSRMVSQWHLPVLLAFVAAPLVAVLLGLAVSLPATRLRGLPLALLTLGFALFMDNFVFAAKAFSGGYAGYTLIRPKIFGLDLGNDRVFGYAALLLAFAAALVVRNLASGQTGRVLSAVRGSELAAEAFGTSSSHTKIFLFSAAAALAGLSGVMVALQVQAVAAVQFNINQSLLYLAVAILGGIATAQGALVAGLLVFLIPELLSRFGLTDYQQLIFGVGAIALLMAGRGGLADLLSRPLLAAADALRGGTRPAAPRRPASAMSHRLPLDRADIAAVRRSRYEESLSVQRLPMRQHQPMVRKRDGEMHP